MNGGEPSAFTCTSKTEGFHRRVPNRFAGPQANRPTNRYDVWTVFSTGANLLLKLPGGKR